ncbi:unnamed protein product [Dibothriocephalus latus]|uniref:Uncharacterized protein n=1 Tax=Dibothriocephalus latus TaxID=60516 RepID=A0A3P7QV26_DIBLA|nr:unnamed protein product [Dibothriocephalus latus]
MHCPSSLPSRGRIFEKKHRFPLAKPYWTRSIGLSPLQRHNFPGAPLIDSRRLQVIYDRLILRNLDVQDEGVYRFGYEYEPDKFSTLCYFAVYLNDKSVVADFLARSPIPLIFRRHSSLPNYLPPPPAAKTTCQDEGKKTETEGI